MKEEIREYIIETFLHGDGNIEDDEQLFESGIIDSIGFIKLLSFIENKYNASIDISEVTIESGTVNGITELATKN